MEELVMEVWNMPKEEIISKIRTAGYMIAFFVISTIAFFSIRIKIITRD